MDLSQVIGMGAPQPGLDLPLMDTSETIQISSLALLKMLKHGRAGVPMEVMGLMLGSFVDEYTIKVVDVFAMPQSGTGVSVEAVDPVFQTKMLDMLRQTDRHQMVVGWYHSHPGFGPWLSSVDVNTQMSFEALNKRAVAVVIDPIQSVKGKVVIDAFRTIPSQSILSQSEARQTTSNIGHLHKPSIVALIHGLNRHYYSIAIDYRKNELEEQMLKSVRQQMWTGGLELREFASHTQDNEAGMRELVQLAEGYCKSLKEEVLLKPEELKNRHVGKKDPKRHLKERAEQLVVGNVGQTLSTMVNMKVF